MKIFRTTSCSPATIAVLMVAALWFSPAPAKTLLVGPSRDLQKPSQAARLAKNGDEILIDAGEYRADAAVWHADDLVIRAVGGPAVLRADGVHAQHKGIWVTAGKNTVIEGITFSGARVRHGNGAGIRHQGVGLTVRHCRFEHNQAGLLTHNDPADVIIIENSVFAHNGAGRGQTHNLYVGRAARLEIRGSYLHHARVGHNVKSRAAVTRILYSRIMDGADGNSSYAVDIPEGGDALLVGNIIQQGPLTENWALVSYGAEGRRPLRHRLRMIHNTLVNDAQDGVFVHVHPGKTDILMANNLLAGPGRSNLGALDGEIHDVHLKDGTPFVNAVAQDYRLRADSRLVDAAMPLPSALTALLREYAGEARDVERPVVGSAPDVGALEKRM